MSEELLNCPFCGGKPIPTSSEYVACENADTDKCASTCGYLRELWNRRSLPEQVKDLVEAAHRLHGTLRGCANPAGPTADLWKALSAFPHTPDRTRATVNENIVRVTTEAEAREVLSTPVRADNPFGLDVRNQALGFLAGHAYSEAQIKHLTDLHAEVSGRAASLYMEKMELEGKVERLTGELAMQDGANEILTRHSDEAKDELAAERERAGKLVETALVVVNSKERAEPHWGFVPVDRNELDAMHATIDPYLPTLESVRGMFAAHRQPESKEPEATGSGEGQ